jgi:8-oxo-dGTP pyrophosphatase MutT (NUDIX family)
VRDPHRSGGAGRATAPAREAKVETSAGGVVYRRAANGPLFLLIRDPYQNWGLPKGHIEAGETAVDAAIREVSEETGLCDLIAGAELPGIDWYFRDHGRLIHKYCKFFLMECRAGEAQPQVEEGISACIWLPLPDALRTVTYDNARQVLREAGRRLHEHRHADGARG